MKTMHSLLFALLLLLLPDPARAGAAPQVQDGDKITVALTDPSRPVMLKASLMNGSITVRGYAGNEVVVEAKERPGSEIDVDADDEEDLSDKDIARRKGMRRITANSSSLSVEEDNNEVTVGTGWRGMSKTLDLLIQVPVNTSMKLGGMNDGEISVTGVRGDIEVSNLNGGITLKDISGSVVADALNDDIDVVFSAIDPKKSMSFSSMNGDIDVTLPSDAKATLKLKSDMGEIYSDFDMKLESSPTRIEETPRPDLGPLKTPKPPKSGGWSTRSGRAPRAESGRGRYKVTIEKVMTGSINGGGTEISFQNFNGNIYVRKGK